MKFLCSYDGTHFIPSSADSVEAWSKLRRGQEYMVSVKQARNPRFHRLLFGLVQAMFQNQERFDNFEAFRTELKILCGSYDHYLRANGEMVYMPHSWEFSQMDETEFHEVYENIVEIAVKRFGAKFVEQFEGTV